MWCRGIRGATVVPENTRQGIVAASKELLQEMVQANEVAIGDVACILFTMTPDLDAAFPAAAARGLGWTQVALLCGQEIDVPGSMGSCLRVLMLLNTEKRNEEIVHVYLREAEALRDEADKTQLGVDKI